MVPILLSGSVDCRESTASLRVANYWIEYSNIWVSTKNNLLSSRLWNISLLIGLNMELDATLSFSHYCHDRTSKCCWWLSSLPE